MEEQTEPLLQRSPHSVGRILRDLSARVMQRMAWVCRTWRNYGIRFIRPFIRSRSGGEVKDLVGALLQSAPHIVKRVLRHLPARDILRMARVCRMWRNYGRIVLQERRRIVTMTAEKYVPRNPQMTIVDNPETKKFLRGLHIECRLAVTFQVVDVPSLDSSDINFKALQSCLPRSSAIIGASDHYGIIGTSTNGLYHKTGYPKMDCLSAFLLPKSLPNGTHIAHFSLSVAHTSKLVKTRLRKAMLAHAFKWPEDQTMKCIILLSSKFTPTEVDRKLLNAIRTVYDGKVALAGGTIEKLYYFSAKLPDEKKRLSAVEDIDSDFSDKEPAYVGLVFGGENVRAASLVIRPQKRTKEGVKRRLMELKAVIDGWGECKQKFGFMFAWANHGRQLLGADDFKMAIFRRLMPDIPLNGIIFYRREFGWDYLPPAAAIGPVNDALHCATTTIAVIGFV